MTKITQVISLDSEDPSRKEKEDSSPQEDIPKAPFHQRLSKVKKGSSIGGIMEISKQVLTSFCLMLLNKCPFILSFLKIFTLKREPFMYKRRQF